jgi:NAD(P)-dependent dehydrogenase (short-subunit alcohol dehydrogenase family)
MKTSSHPVAIVTGVSSGVGLGVTLALLERSYRVVANSRSISKSNDLKSSQDLVLVEGDIGKKETALEMVDAAIKHFGRIDLLVNNAGILIPNPLTDFTKEDFEKLVTTNLAEFFYVTQQVMMEMRKQKSEERAWFLFEICRLGTPSVREAEEVSEAGPS